MGRVCSTNPRYHPISGPIDLHSACQYAGSLHPLSHRTRERSSAICPLPDRLFSRKAPVLKFIERSSCGPPSLGHTALCALDPPGPLSARGFFRLLTHVHSHAKFYNMPAVVSTRRGSAVINAFPDDVLPAHGIRVSLRGEEQDLRIRPKLQLLSHILQGILQHDGSESAEGGSP